MLRESRKVGGYGGREKTRNNAKRQEFGFPAKRREESDQLVEVKD